MAVMRRTLLPLVFALLGLLDSEGTGALADSFSGGSSFSLSSAFSRLNTTVGGRLHSAVPFEKDCFSTVEGRPANASAEGCTILQANYLNPLYRMAHFAAYMTVRSSPARSEHGSLLTCAFFLRVPTASMGNMPVLGGG